MTNKDNKKNKKMKDTINSWKQKIKKNVNCFMLRGSCSNMVKLNP